MRLTGECVGDPDHLSGVVLARAGRLTLAAKVVRVEGALALPKRTWGREKGAEMCLMWHDAHTTATWGQSRRGDWPVR